MLNYIRGVIALALWSWLMKPVFPTMSIYAPGCEHSEDVPVKAFIIADSNETLALILSGQTMKCQHRIP